MRTTFFILTLILSISVHGQDKPWDLERCIDHAVGNNLDVHDQVLLRKQQQLTLDQSKAARYPNLNSSVGHNYNFGRAIDPFTNQFVNQRIQSNSFSLTAGVTLYNGFRITNTIERNQEQLRQGGYNVEVRINDIMTRVAEAYLNVIFAMQNLKIAETQDSSTRYQIERVKKLVEGGRLNRSELLNLQAQNASDKLAIQRAKGDVDLSYLNLKILLQLDPELPFEIVVPELDQEPTINSSDKEQVIARALDEMPEMKSAQSQNQIAQLNRDIAKANLQPRLSMFANLNTVYSESRKEIFNVQPRLVEIGYVEGTGSKVVRDDFSYDTRVSSFGSQLSDNFGQSVGLSLSIPIYNNEQVNTQVQSAEIAMDQANIQVQRVKNQLRSDISNNFIRMENAHASFLAASENEVAQNENYQFSLKRFENGFLTSLELLMTRNNWQRALLEKERARFELIFAKAQVEFYRTGKVSLD